MRRPIIHVDEAKCDGCGQCIPACPEGALQIVDGKARVARASYCDGLGACLGRCPQGALTVLEAEAETYDEPGVIAHLRQDAPDMLPQHLAHLAAHRIGPAAPAPAVRPAQADPVTACPTLNIQFQEPRPAAPEPSAGRGRSELRQWPVQLRLAPVRAPFFQDANLTLVADCVPFAYPNFHADFLRGAAIAVGCPKLDDASAYVEKVTQILQANNIRSLKVLYMEVPCCRGLVRIAEMALARSGKDIPFESVLIEIGV